jgi:hypothetical protein
VPALVGPRARSAVSLKCRNIPRSQHPSPSMGEGLGGGDGAAAKAPQRSTSDPRKPFLLQKIILVPALTNGPDFRHSRVASGDLADINPHPTLPIKGEGFRMFGTAEEFELRVPRAVL